MKFSKTKRSLYFRIFTWLLSIWFVLMAGFSAYLLHEAKITAEETFGKDANSVYNFPSDTVIEIALSNHTFSSKDFEFAIYTDDYDLIYDTRNTWISGYRIPTDTNLFYHKYGFLYPEKWFSKEEIEDLKYYINYSNDSTNIGDFYNYSIDLSGWVDGLEIIPDKIKIMDAYIQNIDDQGNIISTSYTYDPKSDPEFDSGYENTSGLTRYAYMNIQKSCKDPDRESQTYIEVTDIEKLKASATNFTKDLAEGTILKTEMNGLFSEGTIWLYLMLLIQIRAVTGLPFPQKADI